MELLSIKLLKVFRLSHQLFLKKNLQFFLMDERLMEFITRRHNLKLIPETRLNVFYKIKLN